MLLKAKILGFEAEKPIVILNKEDAGELDVRPLDRVELVLNDKKIVGIVNVAQKIVKKGQIGLYGVVEEKLKAKSGGKVNVNPSAYPKSMSYIKKKLAGKVLKSKEIDMIIKDVVKNRLSDIETTAFVTSLYSHGMIMDEIAAMSKAMAMTGDVLDLGKTQVYDKHSLGGCPGDKTSLILVPIIAAAGMAIPKTSSRAITSPAGTADRAECLMPVSLSLGEIKKVVKKTNGCLVWGGAVDLAPADDIFIKVEYPLSIDPLLLPSVMSKKMAVKAKYLVIDMPTGLGTKIKTMGEAHELAKKFMELGKMVKIDVQCASTFGSQPIGNTMGPALEAREALSMLINGNGPADVVDKVLHLAAILMEFKKIKNPRSKAQEILKSGKAYKKLQEIISAQGGNPKIKPDDIPLGSHRAKIASGSSGRVLWINNHSLVQIAKEAGAPKNKGAGILLCKKMGDRAKKGDILFEIFAEKNYKLNRAIKLARQSDVIGVSDRYEMLMSRIPSSKNHPRHFVLER